MRFSIPVIQWPIAASPMHMAEAWAKVTDAGGFPNQYEQYDVSRLARNA